MKLHLHIFPSVLSSKRETERAKKREKHEEFKIMNLFCKMKQNVLLRHFV